MGVENVAKTHWVGSCDFCGKELESGGGATQWDSMAEMEVVITALGWVHEGASPAKGHHLICSDCIPT